MPSLQTAWWWWEPWVEVKTTKDTDTPRMVLVAPMPPPKIISKSNRWLSRFVGHRPLRQSKISTLLTDFYLREIWR